MANRSEPPEYIFVLLIERNENMIKYTFIGLIFLIAACATDNEDDNIKDTDTVLVDGNDTVWMTGERDTVTITERDTVFIKEDEKEDPIQKDWTVGIVEKQHSVRGNAILKDVRLARHTDYERVVVEFEGQIPSYNIKYIDEPHHQCGSGKQIWLRGDGLLEIHMINAAAHNEQGKSTVRRNYSSLDNIKELQLVCDYEGHVNVLAGVGSPNNFAVFELQNPPRLVVDIKKK